MNIFIYSCVYTPCFTQDLLTILPMMDPLTMIRVTGEQLYQALENGVSQWPKLEGRFPQVSGIKFVFDPSKPGGSRVDHHQVKVGEEYLNLEKEYKLVTKAYLATGKDGYDALAEGTVLVDEECAPDLTSAVQNYFQAIMMNNTRRDSNHNQSLITK